MSAVRMGNELQQRGYLPIFWAWIRWLYEMDAVTNVQLCADVGIDRKSLRLRSTSEGWQRRPVYERYGRYIYEDETAEERKRRYEFGLTRAEAFKTGEWKTLDDLHNAAGSQSVTDYLRAREFPAALALRHG